jgi:nicotinate phosphoribosyltransferase
MFHTATDAEIKRGDTTDVYFVRTEQVLEAKGLATTKVLAEITTGALPLDWPWAVISGVEEQVRLLEGKPVDVDAFPEGTLFRPRAVNGYRTPVMSVEGSYGSFCRYETPLLGLTCQSSGISTAAARIRKAAGDKPVINFGARRVHPCLSPLIGRAAYIGGLDGVSSLAAAKLLDLTPTGTMPHALIVLFGDQVEAWKAFDEVVPEDVSRIALVDTYCDEKTEAIMAVKALGEKLWGIRLDTPGSRKGDFAAIIREVRWELDIRGFHRVKIFVSGGLTDHTVAELDRAGADGFGVGTWISNAPVIDFAMDIVQKAGEPVAKRGKLGGKKQVWRCERCSIDLVLPYNASGPPCPTCASQTIPMLQPLMRNGKVVVKLPTTTEIRKYVIEQLNEVSSHP